MTTRLEINRWSDGDSGASDRLFSCSETFHLSTAITCSTISSGVKLRFQPSRPLAQKRQPYAQPTCVEMHRVRRSLGSPYKVGLAGINTLSMSDWSPRRQRNFWVESCEPCLR